MKNHTFRISFQVSSSPYLLLLFSYFLLLLLLSLFLVFSLWFSKTKEGGKDFFCLQPVLNRHKFYETMRWRSNACGDVVLIERHVSPFKRDLTLNIKTYVKSANSARDKILIVHLKLKIRSWLALLFERHVPQFKCTQLRFKS